MTSLPVLANADQTTTDFDHLAEHLERYHGIPPSVASDRLHYIKESTGRRGDDDLVFDLTGNAYAPNSGEYLGSLTQGGSKGPS